MSFAVFCSLWGGEEAVQTLQCAFTGSLVYDLQFEETAYEG